MVNYREIPSSLHDDSTVSSIIVLSASLLSFVAIFMGIKLRWFRHRLTFEQTDSPVVLLRSTSVTQISESCANGVYRQSLDIENMINNSQVSRNTQIVTKSTNRESIFRWPFRGKLNLSRFSSTEDDQNIVNVRQPLPVYSTKTEQDVVMTEKNEKLMRLIYNRLNSDSENGVESIPEVKYEERAVEPRRIAPEAPLKEAKAGSKVELPKLNMKQELPDSDSDTNLYPIPPPTPMKRTSIDKSNLFEVAEPPLVKPRTKRLNYRSSLEPIAAEPIAVQSIEVPSRVLQIGATKIDEQEVEESKPEVTDTPTFPKSILKSSETTSNPKTIKFQDIPSSSSSSSSSSSDEEEEEEEEEDIWSRVDQHRYQLNRQLTSEKDSPPPPPLPRTPPPRLDDSFA